MVYIGQEKLRGMYNTSELMKLGTLVGDDELELDDDAFGDSLINDEDIQDDEPMDDEGDNE